MNLHFNRCSCMAERSHICWMEKFEFMCVILLVLLSSSALIVFTNIVDGLSSYLVFVGVRVVCVRVWCVCVWCVMCGVWYVQCVWCVMCDGVLVKVRVLYKSLKKSIQWNDVWHFHTHIHIHTYTHMHAGTLYLIGMMPHLFHLRILLFSHLSNDISVEEVLLSALILLLLLLLLSLLSLLLLIFIGTL